MMNVKKVSTVFFGLFSFFMMVHNPLVAKFTSKQDAIIELKNVLRRVFGVSNIFEEKINFSPLDSFISQMDLFVNEKSVNALGVKDSDIIASYQKIRGATLSLINCIKIVFNAYIFKPNKTPKDRADAQAQINKIDAIHDVLNLQLKNPVLIKLKNGVTTMQGKKDVIDVLQEMCREIVKIAAKAEVDYMFFGSV